MTEPLFDGYEPDPDAIPPTRPDGMSAGQLRTVRQAAAIRRHVHPLALVDPAIVMHRDGNTDATRDDPGPGPHCGDCHFRRLVGGHDRDYPKCTARGDKLMTHGAATDVRAWWPACTHHVAATATDTSTHPNGAV